MVWARLDDEILDNPKIVRVGPIGFALHVAAITWCSRNLTDGFIPEHKARTILPLRWAGESKASPEASANLRQVRWTLSMTSGMAGYEGEEIIDSTLALLVEAGLWIEDFDERGNLGYRIHDYDKYNPSREQVLRERAEGRERAKKSKASREASPSLRPKLRRDFGVSSGRPVPDPVNTKPPLDPPLAGGHPDGLVEVVPGNAVNDAPAGQDPAVAPGAPPARPKASDRGTRLPEDWRPSEGILARLRKSHPHTDAERHVERFKNYWLAKPGKDGRKLDWDRTFYNWVDKDAERGPPARGPEKDPGPHYPIWREPESDGGPLVDASAALQDVAALFGPRRVG